jgi:hypothetical protein
MFLNKEYSYNYINNLCLAISFRVIGYKRLKVIYK